MASSAGGAANGFEMPVSALHDASAGDAELLYNRGRAAVRDESYDEAVDSFSKALDIRVRLFGELGPECAQTYYKLGCALLYKVQAESDAMGDAKAGKGPSSSSAEGSKLPANDDDSEDEEDEKTGAEGMVVEDDVDDDEETDLELAWKVLDIARIIHAKDAERTLAEVDVITTLADISLEREHFQLCFDDYNAALAALENLVEADNRRIAELCFKISVAKQLDHKPQEALDYCKRAIAVCERRVERLNRELPTGKVLEPNKGVEVKTQVVVEAVTTDIAVAHVSDTKLSSEADQNQAEGLEKTLATETVTEITVDCVVPESKDVKLSPEDEVKAEVKEIEELLVDLKERVEELQTMATAPSLLEALKASNPEAAAMITQVYSRTMGAALDNGGSSGTTSTSQGGGSSSSAAPVTNLGVMGRGVKRATPIPISDEQSSEVQPKKRTTEDVLNGGGSGKTQIGFNGHS